jgi:hypothetical protein
MLPAALLPPPTLLLLPPSPSKCDYDAYSTVLSELALHQCHACKGVYCRACCVSNYDAATEDRVFCLECNVSDMGRLDCDEDGATAALDTAVGCSAGSVGGVFSTPRARLPPRPAAGSSYCSSYGSSRSSLLRACSIAATAAAAAVAATPTPFGGHASALCTSSSAGGAGGSSGGSCLLGGLGAVGSPLLPFGAAALSAPHHADGDTAIGCSPAVGLLAAACL